MKRLKHLPAQIYSKKKSICIAIICIVFSSLYSSAQDQMVRKGDAKPVNVELKFSINPEPAYITVAGPNYFVRTQADGFVIPAANDDPKYKKIGTTYITWQAKGTYEIIIYTDNYGSIPEGSRPAQSKAVMERFAGLRVPDSYWNGSFMPKNLSLKFWYPGIGGGETAPVNPDASITQANWDAFFSYVPEKFAYLTTTSLPGSYKKVIAKTGDLFPDGMELTFAMNISDPNIYYNHTYIGVSEYIGTVYLNLIGN